MHSIRFLGPRTTCLRALDVCILHFISTCLLKCYKLVVNSFSILHIMLRVTKYLLSKSFHIRTYTNLDLPTKNYTILYNTETTIMTIIDYSKCIVSY